MNKTIVKLVMPAFFGVSMLMSCGNNGFDVQDVKNENTNFKVYGNCGMCEKRIEKSLKGVTGVSNADWDQRTKIINVSYESDKISIDQIKEKIAEVGYDTDSHRADESVYSELPGCCQYDRPE